MRFVVRLSVLIGLELAAVLVLHSLGELPWLQVPRAGLAEWATLTPPEDAMAAVARLLALAGAYWLLASTLCYTAATAARLPRAVRVAGWATLPAVRRLADRAIAVALVTSSVAGASAVASSPPALGATPGPTASAPAPQVASRPWPPAPDGPVRDRATPPGRSVGEEPPAPRTRPPASPPPALPGAPPPDRGAPGGPAPNADPARPAPGERTGPGPGGQQAGEPAPNRPTVHVVEPGDNLWSITVTYLQAAGADHDAAAVHAVWLEVVATNRDRLRSGDPDLIHPGESITLSPLPEPGSPTST